MTQPMRSLRIIIAAVFSLGLAVAPVAAQLPTATGRQIAMSDSNWKLFIPSTYQHRPNDTVDLLINFKGDPQTIWNNAQYANLNTVIVTVHYGDDVFSEGFATPFRNNTSLFQSLMDQALTKVRAEADFSDTLQWGKVGASSWSAGYGSLREILKSATYRNRLDALVMSDSLYAGLASDGTAVDSQVVDFKTYAGLAKNGTKSFILDHSSESVPYASTTVCANEILAYLGLTAQPVDVDGLGPLHFFRHAKSGNFELWGESSTTAEEHYNHLYYMGEFLEDMPLAKLTNFAADFNKDGTVNGVDLGTWHGAYGAGPGGDTDGDGDSDGADFLAWQRQSGLQPSEVLAGEPVPEPTACGVAIVALAAVAHMRRRSVA